MRGRPKKEDSREFQYRVRLNEEEEKMLNYTSSITGKPKSVILRNAVHQYFGNVLLNEYINEKESNWSIDNIDLNRIINCPYCGAKIRVDFSDEYEQSSYERQMGEEILYEFDIDNQECPVCFEHFKIDGYISEYPIGAFNSEEINITKK